MNRLRNLAWKEWRDQRSTFYLLAFALPVGAFAVQQLLLADFVRWDREAFRQWLLPLASGLAGVVLAAELSTSDGATPSGDLLARLPVHARSWLAAKLGVLLLGVTLLSGWLVLLQEAAYWAELQNPHQSHDVSRSYNLLPFLWAGLATSWALAFGALLRSNLGALMCALILPAMGLWAASSAAAVAIGAVLAKQPSFTLWGPAVLAPIVAASVALRPGRLAASQRRASGSAALLGLSVVLAPAGLVAKESHRRVARPELGEAWIEGIETPPDGRYVLAGMPLRWRAWRAQRPVGGWHDDHGERLWLLDTLGQQVPEPIDRAEALRMGHLESHGQLWGYARRPARSETVYHLEWRENDDHGVTPLPTCRRPVCLQPEGRVLLIDDWGRLVSYDATAREGRVILSGVSEHALLWRMTYGPVVLFDGTLRLIFDGDSGALVGRAPFGWRVRDELQAPWGFVLEPNGQMTWTDGHLPDSELEVYHYRIVDAAGEVEWSLPRPMALLVRAGPNQFAAIIDGGVVLLDREGRELRQLAPRMYWKQKR